MFSASILGRVDAMNTHDRDIITLSFTLRHKAPLMTRSPQVFPQTAPAAVPDDFCQLGSLRLGIGSASVDRQALLPPASPREGEDEIRGEVMIARRLPLLLCARHYTPTPQQFEILYFCF